MKSAYLTCEQARRIDQIAVEEYGFHSLVLMENAGRGAAEALLNIDPTLADHRVANRVGILCGKGNNAGDGFVVARHLGIRGVVATVVLLGPPTHLAGDALANYRILQKSGAAILDLSGVDDLCQSLDEQLRVSEIDWLVDAMLGTGAKGAPRPPYDAAIRWLNGQPARRLALDLPSGLNADSGEPADPTVRADLTCTFVARKVGFAQPAATAHLGEVRTISIGVPRGLVDKL